MSIGRGIWKNLLHKRMLWAGFLVVHTYKLFACSKYLLPHPHDKKSGPCLVKPGQKRRLFTYSKSKLIKIWCWNFFPFDKRAVHIMIWLVRAPNSRKAEIFIARYCTHHILHRLNGMSTFVSHKILLTFIFSKKKYENVPYERVFVNFTASNVKYCCESSQDIWLLTEHWHLVINLKFYPNVLYR